eukprot:TRINITY_DN2690_c0_g1_i2.p1 TRINITY_DN2690_c0_g1~~TRINITY_DN2690_c0_g1_i2.p1  ORF type:complete len:630 (-),score=132.95 TRINITY_DN2690_c0_g1_i2:126-2015(-)
MWGFIVLLVNSVLVSALRSPPNIVFFLLDDVGWADVSYNNPKQTIPTPYLDKLSSQGIRLNQHYVHPTCTPTRAALLTGRYSANSGLTFPILPGSVVGLPDGMPTLPQMLRQQGYNAHMVGKWHLGHAQWKQTPVGKGFESHTGCFMWDIDSWTKEMHLEPWTVMARDWVQATEDGNYSHYLETRHSTQAITTEAQRQIREHALKNSSKPLFLYVAFTAAHSPLQPMTEHAEKCKHIPHQWRRDFCGMVVGIDEAVKNITRTVRRKLGKNTLLLLSSDNGGSTWFGGLNQPLRSGKTTPFEGGSRVPAFVVDLSHKYFGKGGRTFNGLLHISDWFPTLLSIAGVNKKTIADLKLDGHNVAETLQSGDEAMNPRDRVLIDMFYGSKGEAVFSDDTVGYRKGKYKIVLGTTRDPNWYYEPTSTTLNSTDTSNVVYWGERVIQFLEGLAGVGPFDSTRVAITHQILHSYYAATQSSGNVMLFDLEVDPEEKNNIAVQFPEVVSDLKNDIDVIRKERPPQQKYWMTIPPAQWANTLREGECPPNTDFCRFTHPYFADDVNLSTIQLIDGAYMPSHYNRALRTGLARLVEKLWVPVLVIWILWRLWITRGGGGGGGGDGGGDGGGGGGRKKGKP